MILKYQACPGLLVDAELDLWMLIFLRVLSLQRCRMSSGLGRGGMTGASRFASFSETVLDSSGMLPVGYKYKIVDSNKYNSDLQDIVYVYRCVCLCLYILYI